MALCLLSPLGLTQGPHPENAACVELENFANAQYTAAMQIGSPPQTLKMIPASGSSDLVVPSADCGAEDGCIGAHSPLYISNARIPELHTRGGRQPPSLSPSCSPN